MGVHHSSSVVGKDTQAPTFVDQIRDARALGIRYAKRIKAQQASAIAIFMLGSVGSHCGQHSYVKLRFTHSPAAPDRLRNNQ